MRRPCGFKITVGFVRVIGLCVRMAKKGRPAAHAVVVEGTFDAPVHIDQFELSSMEHEVATQLRDLASGLRSRIAGLKPDRVVIRRADLARVASNKEGPRLRLLAEGALAAGARDEISDVVVLTGRDLGVRAAVSKGDLDTAAAHKLPGLPPEAAAAALVGLVP